MKRLAIATGVFLGVVLACLALARGQQENPAPAAPVGVVAYLEVGRHYYLEVENTHQEANHNIPHIEIPFSVRVLAKPEGGWVLIADSGDNSRTMLVNLSYLKAIRAR